MRYEIHNKITGQITSYANWQDMHEAWHALPSEVACVSFMLETPAPKTLKAIAMAKATRNAHAEPEGWIHTGGLCYRHPASGAHYDGMYNKMYRPGRGSCYAYDIHEAAAISAMNLRHL